MFIKKFEAFDEYEKEISYFVKVIRKYSERTRKDNISPSALFNELKGEDLYVEKPPYTSSRVEVYYDEEHFERLLTIDNCIYDSILIITGTNGEKVEIPHELFWKLWIKEKEKRKVKISAIDPYGEELW